MEEAETSSSMAPTTTTKWFGGTLMNFPEDGLAEFQIATKFTAEVGRSSSSIINVATKSGTNDVHGSEYFFFRHKALQGLPATFDRRGPTPRFAREQFGGSLGGPFITDKLFAFFAGEYLNQDHAVPVGVRNFATNTVSGGSATAFVHDVRITSKGDWVPDPNDISLCATPLNAPSMWTTASRYGRWAERPIASSLLTGTIPFSPAGRKAFPPRRSTR